MNIHKYRNSHNKLQKLSKILSICKTVYYLYLNYITKFRKLPLISKTDYCQLLKTYIFLQIQNFLNIKIPHSKIYEFSHI